VSDRTCLREVRRAGQQIDSFYKRIDVLINNAGVHAFSQRITPDGFSEMAAVNYLAPWVLTNTLRDKLEVVERSDLRRRPVGRIDKNDLLQQIRSSAYTLHRVHQRILVLDVSTRRHIQRPEGCTRSRPRTSRRRDGRVRGSRSSRRANPAT
jgi:NAD(P)-dependent dehydrogenase (short-subunit alcohol dehydrogenase family)